MALLMSSKTKTGRELVEGMSSSGCVRDAALKILYLPRQQSLCAISEYFRLIKTYLILTPCQITPLWVWFNHLTVFYCTDCHKKIKKNKINIMFHCELHRPDSSSGPVSDPGDEPRRWWKVDGDKLACFVGEKCRIHPSPSACWQNRKQGWVMVCTFPLAVWSALTSTDFKETVYDIQKQRKCLFRCSQRMNPDDFGDLLTFQLATPRHWVTLTSAYEHWHWLLACYC